MSRQAFKKGGMKLHTYPPLPKPEEPSPGRCSPAGQCSTSVSAPWCRCQTAKNEPTFVLPRVKNQVALAARLCTH